MPDRLTLIFQMTTVPDNATSAIPHTAGWSESFFTNGNLTEGSRLIQDLINARRMMLPGQAAIVGYRMQKYTISGAKLVPGGAQTVRALTVGNTGFACDVPGMSLLLGAQGSSPRNGSRITLKAIPDARVVGGEYSPSTAFTGHLTLYIQQLQAGGWGFIGRDKTKESRKIKSIANGLVELYEIPGVDFGVNDWFSFNKCTDTQNRAVTGVYQSAGSPDGQPTKFAVQGLDPLITVTKPNGLVRPFVLLFQPYSNIKVSRIVTRKVGRPLEGYRGRASKARR